MLSMGPPRQQNLWDHGAAGLVEVAGRPAFLPPLVAGRRYGSKLRLNSAITLEARSGVCWTSSGLELGW